MTQRTGGKRDGEESVVVLLLAAVVVKTGGGTARKVCFWEYFEFEVNGVRDSARG